MSKVKLRTTHFDQLISYAESAEREGWYYGNEDQFQKRHKEILEFLNEQLKSLEKPKHKEKK
jgi:hypothetical protein